MAGGGVFALFAGQRCIQQQFGHSDDAVQRRANLVAHIRQESAFHFVGVFGSVTSVTEISRALFHHLLQIVQPVLEPIFQLKPC